MMTDLLEVIQESVPNQEAANALMARVFDAAKPETVFGAPVTQGEYTVITAAEVTVGLGYGYGGGGGIGNTPPEANEEKDPDAPADTTMPNGAGFGGGGGGGGGAGARPVAAIEIGPNGVRVEPIIDPTKVVLAFFTTLGAMLMMLSRMRPKTDTMDNCC
jgi:uncharacterized spore protein YtfJ